MIKKKNRYYKLALLLLIFVFLFIGCSYYSKESYIKEYGNFVSEVSQNYEDYDKKEWNRKNGRYKKFSEKWHKKFQNDLTIREQYLLLSYQMKYNLYNTVGQATDITNGLTKEIAKELMQDYIEVQDSLMQFLNRL